MGQAVAVAKERKDEVVLKARAEVSQRWVRDAIQRLRMATIGMLDQCMEELNECVTREGPLLGQYEAAVRQEVDLVIAMSKEKRAVQIVAKVKADIQKMRMALPETLDATETKLREVLLEEIGNLGVNEPQIHEEAEKAIEYAKRRAELLEAKRKKEEAYRLK